MFLSVLFRIFFNKSLLTVKFPCFCLYKKTSFQLLFLKYSFTWYRLPHLRVSFCCREAVRIILSLIWVCLLTLTAKAIFSSRLGFFRFPTLCLSGISLHLLALIASISSKICYYLSKHFYPPSLYSVLLGLRLNIF